MKVRFYPANIRRFRNGDFDFSFRKCNITLVARTIFDYKDFYDRKEFVEYLVSNGIKLNSFKYPLRIDKEKNFIDNRVVFRVHQKDFLGWMVEL